MPTPTDYVYSVAGDTANGAVHHPSLLSELQSNASLSVAPDGTSQSGDVLTIHMRDVCDAANQTAITASINAHTAVPIEAPVDADGAPITLPKIAPAGWHYQERAIEFKTGDLSAVINDKFDGSDWGDVTIKFYDAQGTEMTDQAAMDQSCVKTVVDWSPVYTYGIVGGFITHESTANEDVRMWTIGAPGLPGGDLALINGFNFKFLGESDRFNVDGRTIKIMTYIPGLAMANTIRTIITHPPSSNKHELMMVFAHYKAP